MKILPRPLPAPSPAAQAVAPAAAVSRPAETGSRSVFEALLAEARAPVNTDGRVFVAAAVEQIRARTATGQPSTVVFDIDDTLSDTRGRTLAIAKAYDQAQGTHHFDTLTVDQVTYPPTQMLRQLGMPPDEQRRFNAQWQPKFFAEEAMDHDLPIAPMIQLAKEAAEAGAEVLFLTGRSGTQREATVEELARLGLPQAESSHLFMFPEGAGADFKGAQLRDWQQGGRHLSFFITDSRSDVALVQRLGLQVPPVLLESPLADPNQPVSPLTPVFPFPSSAPAFSPWELNEERR